MNNAHKNLTGFQLSKLYTFEVAARHESFALAAEELFLTPSAVSHQINQLEKELEIKLFLRLHRKVKLTPEGTRILDALQSSLDVLNSEINALKNQSLVGALTLYARPSIAQCWLLPHLPDFIQRYPHIQLSILTGNENVNFQRTGIDLALYFDHQPSTQLNYQYLMDESIIPVCSPEYAEKMEKVRQEVYRQLGREDLLDEKESPYDKETLDKYKKEHEAGKDIPFGVRTSLIAQRMIPREGGPDKGKKVKSSEYK